MDRRLAWPVAIAAMLTMTVSYVDRMTLSVLGPAVSDALDISETGFGWLQSAFSIAYLLATPVAGWWLDRAGARRGLAMSILAWSVVAALHALVPTFGVLFALRIALGLAEGPGFPAAAQTVYRVLPAEDRPRGFGMLFMGSSLGSSVAPLLVWLLLSLGGNWRVAFLGTAIVGLLWIPLWVTLSGRARALLDVPAPPRRATPWSMLKNPAIVRALIAVLAIAPVLALVMAWGAKYLHATFHIDQADVGAYLWLPPLCLDAGAFGFGDLAVRTKRTRVLFAIAVAMGACVALLAVADGPWLAIAVASVAMAGGGAVYTLVTAELLAHVPAEQVSTASGVVAMAQSVAFVIANPLIGAALDRWHDYGGVAIAIAVWVVPGAIAWLALGRREDRS